jgi:hypothetical protein
MPLIKFGINVFPNTTNAAPSPSNSLPLKSLIRTKISFSPSTAFLKKSLLKNSVLNCSQVFRSLFNLYSKVS